MDQSVRNQVLNDRRHELDDSGRMQALDPRGMLEAVRRLPEQLEAAAAGAGDFGRLQLGTRPRAILLAGMGGSAIGGDLAAALLAPRLPVPLLVNRSYQLPAWVGPETLLVAASYSGDTEETLSCFEEGLRRGCPLAAVSSGGILSRRAREQGIPLFEVPSGFQPRAAVGWMLLPILAAAALSWNLDGIPAEAAAAVKGLRVRANEWGSGTPLASGDNLAKTLAVALVGRIPFLHGTSGTTEAVARRWKTQLNENAKCMAHYDVYPELDHNEIVGFQKPEGVLSSVSILQLRSEWDHARNRKRAAVTNRLLRHQGAEVTEVAVPSSSPTEEALALILLGDFISVYLAFLYGLDPTPVEAIRILKSEMAR